VAGVKKGDIMSARETAAIAIKFLGLFLIINIVIFMPSLAFQIIVAEHVTGDYVDRTTVALFIGAYFTVGLIICYVLFRLANSILKSTPDVARRDESRMSEKFLLQLIGAYFFVSAASSLPRFIPMLSGIIDSSTRELWYLPGIILELGIGLWLIAGSSLWASWLRKARHQS
jgi:hypothetical protein